MSGKTALTGGTVLIDLADVKEIYAVVNVDEADIGKVLQQPQFILGKFIALCGFFAVLVVLALAMPASLAVGTHPDWGRLCSGLLGLLLFAAALTAIAIFKGMGWRGTFPLFFVLMAVAFFGVLVLKVEETKSDEPPSIGSSLG